MIGDPGSHGRRLGPMGVLQTLMRGAEVVDGAHQIHTMLQGHCPARQRSTPPCQSREPLAKGGIEPFDVGGVDDPVALRATPERLDARGRSRNDAPLHGDDASLLVAFHDLCDQDMPPRSQPGTPLGSRPRRVSKRLANRPAIGTQPIGTEQEWTMPRAPTYLRDETTNERQVAVGAHGASEPQAGTDHQRQGHPHEAPLGLDADLVGLHLPQVTWLLDQMLLDRLTLDASTRQPTRHRPLVIAKRHDDRLQWTTMGHQRHHETDRLRRGPQAIEGRAFRGGERLVALGAHEALLLTRVDANVALAYLSSGGAGQIRAECGCGVHEDSPLLALLGSVPRRSMSGPPLLLQVRLTTVKCGATDGWAPGDIMPLPDDYWEDQNNRARLFFPLIAASVLATCLYPNS